MSRHTKIKDVINKGMEEDDYDYSDGEAELSKDEWDMVDSLGQMFNLSESESIKILEEVNFDFDKAVTKIQRQIQKQKEKDEKKQREKQQKQAKMKEEARIKLERHEKQQHSPSKMPKLEDAHRKSSLDELGNVRKNSHIVEDVSTDHYNVEYPSVGDSKTIVPSNTINIVVVGHVDSGKSTLVGMFLKEAEMLSKKELHRNEKQSKQMGMQAFKHAWVTDSTEEERIRGVTIDVGVKKLEIGGKKITFLDSPGHRDFIPNMITGAAQADYAILVIDTDNFQSSFIGGGQTKEHAYIVRSFGVHKLIVAMNKMDRVGWSAQKFVHIRQRLGEYLLKIGFTEDQIIYIPISAINATNITKKNMMTLKAENVLYDQCFMDLIANLEMPPRPIDKPFRMTITNVYEPQFGKLTGHCLSGKVEGGHLKKDEKLIILPLDSQCIVKDILVNGEKAREAVIGDNIDVQIKLIEKTAFEAIKQGHVLSSIKYCVPVSRKIVVEALALDIELPVLRGTEVVIYIATNKCPARIVKINYIFNPSDGTVIRKNPKSIKSNQCAEIEVQLSEKMCVELFSNYKTFGRVIIREKKDTLFVGTIKLIK